MDGGFFRETLLEGSAAGRRSTRGGRWIGVGNGGWGHWIGRHEQRNRDSKGMREDVDGKRELQESRCVLSGGPIDYPRRNLRFFALFILLISIASVVTFNSINSLNSIDSVEFVIFIDYITFIESSFLNKHK